MSGRACSGNAMLRVRRATKASRACVPSSPGFARPGHRVEIGVDASEQRNQGVAFRLVQAGEQAPFAFERERNVNGHIAQELMILRREFVSPVQQLEDADDLAF